MQNIVLPFNSWSNKFMLPFSGVPGRAALFCLLSYCHEVCRKVIISAVPWSDVVAMKLVVQKLRGIFV